MVYSVSESDSLLANQVDLKRLSSLVSWLVKDPWIKMNMSNIKQTIRYKMYKLCNLSFFLG